MKTENKRLLYAMLTSALLHCVLFCGGWLTNAAAGDADGGEIFEVIDNIETAESDAGSNKLERFNRKLHINDELIEVLLFNDDDIKKSGLKQLSLEDVLPDIKQKPKIAPIVNAPAVKPKLLTKASVAYPARANGARGKVTVCILVGADGRPEYVSTAGSSGNPALDGAALESSIKWRFSPALDGRGKPVRCLIYVPVLLEP